MDFEKLAKVGKALQTLTEFSYFDWNFVKIWSLDRHRALFVVSKQGSKGAEVRKYCSAWKILQNEFLLGKTGFDTARNEPSNFTQFSKSVRC